MVFNITKFIENHTLLETFNTNLDYESEVVKKLYLSKKPIKTINFIIEILKFYEKIPVPIKFICDLIINIKNVSKNTIEKSLKCILNNNWTSIFSWNDIRVKLLNIPDECLICLDKKKIYYKPFNRGVNDYISIEVHTIYSNTCQRCGIHKDNILHHIYQTQLEFHIGHLFPFSLDKSTIEYTSNNFILLCSKCNIGESNNILSFEEQLNSIENVIQNLELFNYEILCDKLQDFNYDLLNFSSIKNNSKIFERDESICHYCTSIIENGNNHKRINFESNDVNLYPFLFNLNDTKDIDNYITICQICRQDLLDKDITKIKFNNIKQNIFSNYQKKCIIIKKKTKLQKKILFCDELFY